MCKSRIAGTSIFNEMWWRNCATVFFVEPGKLLLGVWHKKILL